MKIALVSPYDFAYPGGVANHISCLERNFPVEYTITPNGVDPGHFRPDVPPINGFNNGKLNILFVGRDWENVTQRLLDYYRRVLDEARR